MSAEVTSKQGGLPAPRPRRRNYMTFPRELRKAIPDLPTYVGRTLELSGIEGTASNTQLFGSRVHLKLELRETGKLKGRFTVGMDIEPDASRALASALTELAERAGRMPETPAAAVHIIPRKRK